MAPSPPTSPEREDTILRGPTPSRIEFAPAQEITWPSPVRRRKRWALVILLVGLPVYVIVAVTILNVLGPTAAVGRIRGLCRFWASCGCCRSRRYFRAWVARTPTATGEPHGPLTIFWKIVRANDLLEDHLHAGPGRVPNCRDNVPKWRGRGPLAGGPRPKLAQEQAAGQLPDATRRGLKRVWGETRNRPLLIFSIRPWRRSVPKARSPSSRLKSLATTA